MKLIIAGSRDYRPTYGFITLAVTKLQKEFNLPWPTEVVSGRARGSDTRGEMWAAHEGLPIRPFPADWKTHGKKAGFLRNAEMAEYADAAIVFVLNESKGSMNMVEQMERRKKPVLAFEVEVQ